MMDLLTKADFEGLLEARAEPAVSIYLPTHRTGDGPQDRIRLKNLLDDAAAELESRGHRPPEVQQRLKTAVSLLDDDTFWAHQEDGLAVFVTDDTTDTLRLPVRFTERVRVGTVLHLAPLAPVVEADADFHLLALSQNAVRLLRGTRFGISEIELRDVPSSLAEALWMDDPERQLQLRSSGAAAGGRTPAIFHGHGAAEPSNDEIVRFFRAVDAGVLQIVDPSVPLVLAGVTYLFPLYRSASQHPSIVEGGVEGNPEHLSGASLHERALPIVEPLLDRDRRSAMERVQNGEGPVAVTLEDVVVAARQSRVDAALIDTTASPWGLVDESSLSVAASKEDGDGAVDLIEDIARSTWTHGGRVFTVDPEWSGSPAAAVLRF